MLLDEAFLAMKKDYYHTGVAYICTAFHIKPSEIDEFTIDEFMNYLAMAEVALGADISIPEQQKENTIQYTEIPDPKTGKTLRVPVANQHGIQSKVKIKDGRR